MRKLLKTNLKIIKKILKYQERLKDCLFIEKSIEREREIHIKREEEGLGTERWSKR